MAQSTLRNDPADLKELWKEYNINTEKETNEENLLKVLRII